MSLSLEAVEEINLIRGLLEAEAIRLAIANMAEDLLDRMDVINEEKADTNKADHVPRFVGLNHELHFALFDRARLAQASPAHRSALEER